MSHPPQFAKKGAKAPPPGRKKKAGPPDAKRMALVQQYLQKK